MGDNTGIEWTDASWNPLRARHVNGALGWSCVKVSAGCANCYAEAMNKRLGTGTPYSVSGHAMNDLVLNEKQLTAPLRWKRPRRIFLSSMTDIALATDEQLDRMFAVMALTPQHTYQVLTKRPERMLDYLRGNETPDEVEAAIETIAADRGWCVASIAWPLPNVWLGVSAENQATADERIPILLDTPAAMRFISAEPLLGPIDLTNLDYRVTLARYYPSYREPKHPHDPEIHYDVLTGHMKGPDDTGLPHLDWVIVGGESGSKARPFDLAWARSLRDQCRDAGVAFFMKQMGRRPLAPCTPCAGPGNPPYTRSCVACDGQFVVPLTIADSAGGDESEWPEDLRGCRAFPGGDPMNLPSLLDLESVLGGTGRVK